MLFRHWLGHKMNASECTGRSSVIAKLGDVTARYIDRWSIYVWNLSSSNEMLISQSLPPFVCMLRGLTHKVVGSRPQYPRVNLKRLFAWGPLLTRPCDAPRERTLALFCSCRTHTSSSLESFHTIFSIEYHIISLSSYALSFFQGRRISALVSCYHIRRYLFLYRSTTRNPASNNLNRYWRRTFTNKRWHDTSV